MFGCYFQLGVNCTGHYRQPGGATQIVSKPATEIIGRGMVKRLMVCQKYGGRGASDVNRRVLPTHKTCPHTKIIRSRGHSGATIWVSGNQNVGSVMNVGMGDSLSSSQLPIFRVPEIILG